MNWNDDLFTGSRAKWSWLVFRGSLPQLRPLAAEHHLGCELHVPGDHHSTEIRRPISAAADLPRNDICEWYIFDRVPDRLTPSYRYSNICGFNLADPHALAASQDPTWERTGFNWLIPIQSQFWSDIERLSPVSYVSLGEDDVIVATSVPGFAELLLSAARGNVA